MVLALDNLLPADAVLLNKLVPLNEELRGVACIIAQLGVRFRREEPARAKTWIEILEPHPFYKFGQVMFDLLEWEDFMLDGEPVEIVPDRILSVANQILSQAKIGVESITLPSSLPELETGFYLYRDVVYGLVWIVLNDKNKQSEES